MFEFLYALVGTCRDETEGERANLGSPRNCQYNGAGGNIRLILYLRPLLLLLLEDTHHITWMWFWLCRTSVPQERAVSSQTFDLNPFANDNFGSLSAEDIVTQQFDQLQMSDKR